MPGGSVSHRIASALNAGDMVRRQRPARHVLSARAACRADAVHRRRQRTGADQIHRRDPRLLRDSPGRCTCISACVRSATSTSKRSWQQLQRQFPGFRAHIVLSDPGAALAANTLLPRRLRPGDRRRGGGFRRARRLQGVFRRSAADGRCGNRRWCVRAAWSRVTSMPMRSFPRRRCLKLKRWQGEPMSGHCWPDGLRSSPAVRAESAWRSPKNCTAWALPS